MKKVREGLYIGSLDDALLFLSGSKSGISHFLSLAPLYFLSNDKALGALSEFRMRESLRNSLLESVKDPETDAACTAVALELATKASAPKNVKLVRKTLPLKDTASQNLLDYLEECLEFIEKGRSEGIVLVHCVAGISRSAAVVTAYLMRTEKLPLNDALASLKQCSKTACPNRGFLQQLQLFEDMGCVVDKSNHIYKKFHLEELGNEHGRGEKIEISKFAADPGQALETQQQSSTSTVDHSEKHIIFRCKKCRRVVASHANVLDHSPGAQQKPYKWKKREKDACFDSESDNKSVCTSVFVEPMQWMTTVEQGVLEGKLLCVNCEAKLGSFHWAGVQCSCGTWINPAFQLHKSRVDASLT